MTHQNDTTMNWQRSEQTGGGYTTPLENNEHAEINLMIKDIYTSRDPEGKQKPRYYVSNEDFHYSAREVFLRFKLPVIREFYNDLKRRDLMGLRKTWHTFAPIEDIQRFIDSKNPKFFPDTTIITVEDLPKSARYMHLIYISNEEIIDVLKSPPNEKLMAIHDLLMKEGGSKQIEVLMDYSISHSKVGKLVAKDIDSVKCDIFRAIQWTQIKPEEYAKYC